VERPQGSTIYDDECLPMEAEYLLVEYADEDWTGPLTSGGTNETNTMTLRVRPQAAGEFWVYVRSAMHRKNGGACEYVNDHPSGGTSATDQQGWTVSTYPITLCTSVEDLTWGAIKALFR
jgi:hypothetical protein